MREVITDGSICLDDEYGFTYHVADIRYIERAMSFDRIIV